MTGGRISVGDAEGEPRGEEESQGSGDEAERRGALYAPFATRGLSEPY